MNETLMLKIGPAEATETRQLILVVLKRFGPITTRAIARRLSLTSEAVRQHIVQLVEQGWVETCKPRRALKKKSGRPAVRFCLTTAGDHLFPKHYDELTIEVLQAITRTFGEDAVLDLFAAMADERVEEWKSEVVGKGVRDRLEFLRDRYAELDRAPAIESSDGTYRLIERNCPFLNVALSRPALCSVTVNVLTRLLGCKVIRVERFQNGDGRCVFRVDPSHRSNLNRFALEPPIPSRLRG